MQNESKIRRGKIPPEKRKTDGGAACFFGAAVDVSAKCAPMYHGNICRQHRKRLSRATKHSNAVFLRHNRRRVGERVPARRRGSTSRGISPAEPSLQTAALRYRSADNAKNLMCRTYSCRGETASSLRHCHRRVGERAPERPSGDVDRQRGKRSSRAAEHRKTCFKAYPLYQWREKRSPRAIERRKAPIPPLQPPACRRTRARAPARRRRSAAWETFFPRR